MLLVKDKQHLKHAVFVMIEHKRKKRGSLKANSAGLKTYYGRLKTRKEDTRTSLASSALCIEQTQ